MQGVAPLFFEGGCCREGIAAMSWLRRLLFCRIPMLWERRRVVASTGLPAAADAGAVPREPVQTGSPGFPAREDGDLDPMLVQLVDLDDELALIEAKRQEHSEAVVALVRQRIAYMLDSCGAEVIRLREWSPSNQRAVKVVAVAGPGAEMRYLDSVSSGLKVSGRLVRKQEVIAGRPGPEQEVQQLTER
jgi:hypothetical protein